METYVPTNEIQVATINWEYKGAPGSPAHYPPSYSGRLSVLRCGQSGGLGRRRPRLPPCVAPASPPSLTPRAANLKGSGRSGLKITEDGPADDDSDEEAQDVYNVSRPPPAGAVGPGSHSVSARDGKTVNVLRGAHAVIFMVDPSKKWTVDYVQRELPKVPKTVSILFLVRSPMEAHGGLSDIPATPLQANFKDQEKTWKVSSRDMRNFAELCGDHVRYLEVSLLNSFGLKGVQLFFNMPFLRLKVRMLPLFCCSAADLAPVSTPF